MATRETENNAYTKFWGDTQKALWYVMVLLEWSITLRELSLIENNAYTKFWKDKCYGIF